MTIDTKLLDALSVPLGNLIAAVGRGVADAQREMDAASLAAYREVYESNEGFLSELQRIGYRPTWYHIPEVESEIQMALTVSGTEQSSNSRGTQLSKMKLYAAPIDAGYSARYNFALQASSRIKFRVVPIPPSNAAETLRVVPVLVGLTVEEVRVRLSLLNVPAVYPEGPETAKITSQTPAPGQLLAEGESVVVGTA